MERLINFGAAIVTIAGGTLQIWSLFGITSAFEIYQPGIYQEFFWLAIFPLLFAGLSLTVSSHSNSHVFIMLIVSVVFALFTAYIYFSFDALSDWHLVAWVTYYVAIGGLTGSLGGWLLQLKSNREANSSSAAAVDTSPTSKKMNDQADR